MINQFGGITVGPATLGRHCNLSQGVTIGASGHGDKHGCPTLAITSTSRPVRKCSGRSPSAMTSRLARTP
jgi:hypothetical protein